MCEEKSKNNVVEATDNFVWDCGECGFIGTWLTINGTCPECGSHNVPTKPR